MKEIENLSANKNQLFKQLDIVFIGLITGQLMFLAVTFYMHYQSLLTFTLYPAVKAMFSFAVVAVIGFIPLGYFLYGAKCKQSSNLNTLDEKLILYRTATMLRLMLFESGGFISLIAYFLTGSNQYVVLLGIVLIAFLINKPSKHRAISDLQLNEQESNIVLNEM